jgi:hypothetical protein
MTYYGDKEDGRGLPDPCFQYLVVASPWVKPGSGSASIVSLAEARARGITPGSSQIIVAKEGGAEAALRAAEDVLDKTHPGLQKIISEQRT